MKTINIELVLDWAKGQDELRKTNSVIIKKALEEMAELKTMKVIAKIKPCPACKGNNVKCRGSIFNCEDCGERW